jgi:hypothetical protein
VGWGYVRMQDDINRILHHVLLLLSEGRFPREAGELAPCPPLITVPTLSLNVKSPIYTFIPSVATSDLIGCPSILNKKYYPYDCLILSSLRDVSLFLLVIDPKKQKVLSSEKLSIGFRIREFQRELKDSIIFSTDGYGVFKIDDIIVK